MNIVTIKSILRYVVCFLVLSFYSYTAYSNDTPAKYVSGNDASLVALSPMGDWVSWVQPTSQGSSLVIRNLQSHEEHVATTISAGVSAIVDYRWINEEKIAFLATSWTYRSQKLSILNVNSGEKTHADGALMGGISLIGATDRELYIQAATSSGSRDFCKIDVNTGKVKVLIRNTKNIFDWLPARDAGVVYATGKVGPITVLYKIDSDGAFKPLVELTSGSDSMIMSTARGFADSDGFYACTSYGNDTAAVVHITSSGNIRHIYSNDQYDVNYIVFGRDDKPVAAGFYSDRQEYATIGSDGAEFQHVLDLHKNEHVVQLGTDGSGKYIIFKIGGRSVPGWYAIYNRETKELVPLFGENKNKVSYLPTTPIKFKARDGLPLHGYLTFPSKANYSPPYSTVVLVHGGPWNRDYLEAEPLSQALAKHGYMVIRVNFRGSVGYGKKFTKTGYKQLGLKMQDDVTDAIEYAKSRGLVDTNCIGIIGASYGGYSALMGLIKTPDLYRCAVSINGPVDPTVLSVGYAQLDPLFAESRREFIGDPVADKALFDSVSPLLRVDEIKKPVLLIQGSFDHLVRAEDIFNFFGKLSNEGSKYLLYKEHHEFAKQSNQDDSTWQILAFVSSNMKPTRRNPSEARAKKGQ
jgi:dipeptidyl aminopeptidase/acylaminoacyl peptidase